jgi:hypothetical protein
MCQMAYMLLNDNIRIVLVTTKIMYENKSIWYRFNVINSKWVLIFVNLANELYKRW